MTQSILVVLALFLKIINGTLILGCLENATEVTIPNNASINRTVYGDKTTQQLKPASSASVAAAKTGVESLFTHLNGTGNDTVAEDDDLSSSFLSFEEWKQKKVFTDEQQQQQQVKDYVGLAGSSHRVDPESEYSLGEENEIDLDLFTHGGPDATEKPSNRFNFASLDCAATVVKTNSEAKSASSILLENKETYLLNQCNSKENYIIIELCEDILIDSIVLGNYEFFSSIFKDINFYVSDRYPQSNWQLIGDFQGKNERNIQLFKVENPLIWAKYLKIEIKSHYGNEFYCPVSIVRVHGRTMMEEYKLKESDEKKKSKLVKPEKPPAPVSESPAPLSAESQTAQTTAPAKVEANKTTVQAVEPSTTARIEKCVENGFEKFLLELRRNESCEAIGLQTLVPKIKPAGPSKREPVTQESIYKNIMNRISLLEANASLSLLYIEEQSKILTEAFSKLEKKHNLKFSMLASAVNNTLQAQIHDFQSLFRDIADESSNQVEAQRHEIQETWHQIEARVGLLTDEIQFQKKIVVLLFTIIACLVGYVIYTRDAYIEGEYTDMYETALEEKDFMYSQDSIEQESLVGDQSPQFNLQATGFERSPLMKRRLKLKISNKFGRSTSTLFLNSHRKNKSSISSSILSDKPPSLITPEHSDTEQ